MEKKIEDYLHYYIGCFAIYAGHGKEEIITITGINTATENYSPKIYFDFYEHDGSDSDGIYWLKKLILRPLSSMTEDEFNELEKQIGFSDDTIFDENTWRYFDGTLLPEQFHYLLSKGFDLFGLIESGLAIDAITFNSPRLR